MALILLAQRGYITEPRDKFIEAVAVALSFDPKAAEPCRTKNVYWRGFGFGKYTWDDGTQWGHKQYDDANGLLDTDIEPPGNDLSIQDVRVHLAQAKKVEIFGYADQVGFLAGNKFLSLLRALAVAQDVTRVNPQISASFYAAGPQPSQGNENADITSPDYDHLRRVEIRLCEDETKGAAAQTAMTVH